jgi:hypothetical protein
LIAEGFADTKRRTTTTDSWVWPWLSRHSMYIICVPNKNTTHEKLAKKQGENNTILAPQRAADDNDASATDKTVQVKNRVLLFWREKTFPDNCVVPKPHSLQNAKSKKLTRMNHGAAGHGLYRLWVVRVRCQLPILVDC